MVEIRRLSPDELPAFLSFMDGPAFETMPQWQGCYCQHYLDLPGEADASDAVRNRKSACDRVAAGTMNGYLAFEADTVIGWVAANAGNNFKALPPTDDKTARIICINIQKEHQGKGVATNLLAYAIDDLASQGFTRVEAAPLASGEFHDWGYRGPLGMYLKAGFEVGPQVDDKHVLVHRKLAV